MKAVIYSTKWCPWCHKAKELLKTEGIEIEKEHLVEDMTTLDALSEKAGKPLSTVPQIWIDGEYVGGYTDLAAKLGHQ